MRGANIGHYPPLNKMYKDFNCLIYLNSNDMLCFCRDMQPPAKLTTLINPLINP